MLLTSLSLLCRSVCVSQRERTTFRDKQGKDAVNVVKKDIEQERKLKSFMQKFKVIMRVSSGVHARESWSRDLPISEYGLKCCCAASRPLVLVDFRADVHACVRVCMRVYVLACVRACKVEVLIRLPYVRVRVHA